jgi:hypothetical protein
VLRSVRTPTTAAKEMQVLFYRMLGELFDVLPVLRNA